MQVVESSRGKVHVVAAKKKTGCGSKLHYGGQTYFWPDAVKVTCRKCMSYLSQTAGSCAVSYCRAKPGRRCVAKSGKRSKRHSTRQVA